MVFINDDNFPVFDSRDQLVVMEQSRFQKKRVIIKRFVTQSIMIVVLLLLNGCTGPHGEHHFVLPYDTHTRRSDLFFAILISENFIKRKSDYD